MHKLYEQDADQEEFNSFEAACLPRNALVISARQRAWEARLVLEEHSGLDSGTGWAAAR